MTIQIDAIPALNNNYIWVITRASCPHAYVVDPGESQPVINYLNHRALSLAGILVTHSHRDHTAGINGLIEAFGSLPVFGPECAAIPQVTHHLKDGDTFSLWNQVSLLAIHTPGHLPEHLCYVTDVEKPPRLFCGDILFSSGCGRNFVGTSEEYTASLARLMGLPDETLIYCAHEYTLSNIQFALTLEPGNTDLMQKRQNAEEKSAHNLPTLPSSIAVEKLTNPFLRTSNPQIKQAIHQHFGHFPESEPETFAYLRKWKDDF